MIVDGDVVVALSHSGETAEIVGLLPSMRRLSVQLIALVNLSLVVVWIGLAILAWGYL